MESCERLKNFAESIAFASAFGSPYQSRSKWKCIGNEIDAAFVFSQDFVTGHRFRLGPRRASVAALRSHRNHGLHGNTEWREAGVVANLPLVLWEKTQQFQRAATTHQ